MADPDLKGPGLTADEALAAWLEHLAHERRLAPNTLEAYGRIGRLYLAFLGRHRGGAQSLSDLGTVTAAEVRAHLAERGNKPRLDLAPDRSFGENDDASRRDAHRRRQLW